MTDFVSRSSGQFRGQPPVLAIPEPWESQPYSPYEPRPRYDPDISIDPGFYVRPELDWGGDPGIAVTPPQDWGGDPGIYATPRTAPTIAPPAEPVDAVGSLDAGDHVKHGAKALIIPGLIGGAVAGALVAGVAPAGLKGAALTGQMAWSTAKAVLGGAAMGLAVASTSPTDKDSLAARYAVAGGAMGLVSGALMPAGFRGAGMVIGGAANAAIGWYVGRSLETSTKADAAAAAADVQLEPTSTPAFPTVAA